MAASEWGASRIVGLWRELGKGTVFGELGRNTVVGSRVTFDTLTSGKHAAGSDRKQLALGCERQTHEAGWLVRNLRIRVTGRRPCQESQYKTFKIGPTKI